MTAVMKLYSITLLCVSRSFTELLNIKCCLSVCTAVDCATVRVISIL